MKIPAVSIFSIPLWLALLNFLSIRENFYRVIILVVFSSPFFLCMTSKIVSFFFFVDFFMFYLSDGMTFEVLDYTLVSFLIFLLFLTPQVF